MRTQLNTEPKILIVEDDPISSFIIEKYLENKFKWDRVSNGYDAIKLMETGNYEIVLMDINLGDEKMDGIRTMRTIRLNRKYRNTKIIAVTSHANSRECYLKLGFDEFFMKPVDENIEDLIKKTLTLPAHTEHLAAWHYFSKNMV